MSAIVFTLAPVGPPLYEPLKSLWSDKEEKFSHWRAKLWFGLPLMGFVGGVFSLYMVEGWHTYSILGGLFISFSVALILAFVFLRNQSQEWRALGLLGISILSSAWAIFPVIQLVIIFIGAAPNLHVDTIGVTSQIVLLIMTLLFVVSFNALLVESQGIRRSSILEYIVLTTVTTCFLLIMLGSTTYIPKRVMNAYQFRFIPASLLRF